MITPTSSNPRAVETENAPPSYGYRSQAIVAAGFLFTGGQIGVPADTSDGQSSRVVTAGDASDCPAADLAGQLELCYQHLDAITVAAGSVRDRVVEVAAFVAQANSRVQVEQSVSAFLGRRPHLLSFQEVRDVAFHGLVELDWIVSLDESLSLDEAAGVLSPFGDLSTGANVVASGPFMITNGVLGSGPDMTSATQDVLRQIETRLSARGATLGNLLKLTVYIDDFDQYPQFDRVTREQLMGNPPPTRSVIVAPELTRGARVRIDVLAQG